MRSGGETDNPLRIKTQLWKGRWWGRKEGRRKAVGVLQCNSSLKSESTRNKTRGERGADFSPFSRNFTHGECSRIKHNIQVSFSAQTLPGQSLQEKGRRVPKRDLLPEGRSLFFFWASRTCTKLSPQPLSGTGYHARRLLSNGDRPAHSLPAVLALQSRRERLASPARAGTEGGGRRGGGNGTLCWPERAPQRSAAIKASHVLG